MDDPPIGEGREPELPGRRPPEDEAAESGFEPMLSPPRASVWLRADVGVVFPHRHDREVICLAFSDDGSLLASADENGAVMVWDVKLGRLVAEMTGRVGRACCLAFSRDGGLLAAGAENRLV